MAVDCTPKALADLATCFNGLSQGQLQAIQTYLMCQAANASGGSGIECLTYAERQAADPTLCRAVIDTTLNQLFYGNGTSWVSVPGGSDVVFIYSGSGDPGPLTGWSTDPATVHLYQVGNDVYCTTGATLIGDGGIPSTDGVFDLSGVASTLDVFDVSSSFGFTTLNASGLPVLTQLYFLHCTALTSIDISGSLLISALNGSDCALPTSQVNAILVQMQGSGVPLASMNIDLSGQTPPAPPSGAGAAAKTAINLAGGTCVTD
jgi:hypothetical protein